MTNYDEPMFAVRGFETEDFIQSNEVHVYGRKAIDLMKQVATMRSVTQGDDGIKYVFHEPGEFETTELEEFELDEVVSTMGISEMWDVVATSDGKAFTTIMHDEQDIYGLLHGKKVAVSRVKGFNRDDTLLLEVSDPGEKSPWYAHYVAEFRSLEELPHVFMGNKDKVTENGDSGLIWDRNPWRPAIEWTVTQATYEDHWYTEPESGMRILDGRQSRTETMRNRVNGFGNVSLLEAYGDLNVDPYEDDFGVVLEAAKKLDVPIKPIYMYSHSGDTIRTTPFGDRWDSGLIGFIYTTAQDRWTDADEAMDTAIAHIDHWMQGDVWYTEARPQGDDTWNDVNVVLGYTEAIEKASEQALSFLRTGNHIPTKG